MFYRIFTVHCHGSEFQNSFLISEVCDPFIPDLTRFPCLIAVLMKFIKPKLNYFKRKMCDMMTDITSFTDNYYRKLTGIE